MRARMLGARGRLCRKALESLQCSCSHVRRGRSLMDWSIVVPVKNDAHVTVLSFFFSQGRTCIQLKLSCVSFIVR